MSKSAVRNGISEFYSLKSTVLCAAGEKERHLGDQSWEYDLAFVLFRNLK